MVASKQSKKTWVALKHCYSANGENAGCIFPLAGLGQQVTRVALPRHCFEED